MGVKFLDSHCTVNWKVQGGPKKTTSSIYHIDTTVQDDVKWIQSSKN